MAGVGKAQVTIAFDAWTAGNVAASHHEIEVIAPGPGPKPEPVSPRLKGELQHPNRKGVLFGLRYSPDGKRIIAGDYPGGVIQVWDAETGKQLTKLDTGYGRRPTTNYFFLTPDWSTLFVSRAKRKATRVEKEGKQMFRWECDGDVRAWDLSSGELRETFKHDPPRSILAMNLSPDGSRFITGDELSGVFERRAPLAMSLWDAVNKVQRTLPGKLEVHGVFSPDSTRFSITCVDDDGYTTAVNVLDAATAREDLSIPITEPFTQAGVFGFTPDGRLLVGATQTYPARNNYESWESALKLWDVSSGKEVASFTPGEKKSGFQGPAFSPDGRTMAMTNWMGEQSKLFLFDLPARKLIKTVILGEKSILREPVFSPDGKWVVVSSQAWPEEQLRAREPEVEELAQPRILVVDVATGKVRETIVAPQGICASACFGPDGQTLATSGHGKVILWDLKGI